jgi:hydrogenase-1 operon protein HyaF
MKRDSGAPCVTDRATGMALSVLAEVGRMLETLAETGQAGSIDLRSLPLTDADRLELEELLGSGEVRAEMELAGASEVWETSYPGAWWIRHRGAGGKIATEEIAVCPVPEILITHPVDIQAASRKLRQDIESLSNTTPAEPSETTMEATNG